MTAVHEGLQMYVAAGFALSRARATRASPPPMLLLVQRLPCGFDERVAWYEGRGVCACCQGDLDCVLPALFKCNEKSSCCTHLTAVVLDSTCTVDARIPPTPISEGSCTSKGFA